MCSVVGSPGSVGGMAPAYTGHVEPRGAPIRRLIAHPATTVAVTKLSVGPMDNNCYIIADTARATGIVIDAAADADRILAAIGDLDITAVLTTHHHRDHWQALADVIRATGARALHHREDASQIPVPADGAVADGDQLAVGAAALEIRHTPGHTAGSVCAVLDGVADDAADATTHVFTGDTLFPGGPGKTVNDHAFATIMASLDERLFTLPDDTWVYPGHGDDTTIGTERPHLEEWRQRGW